MKTLLRWFGLVCIVLVVNVVTVLVLLDQLPVTIAGSDDECVLGDVNDDGVASLADPIFLLNWLYLDGPEPTACAQSDAPEAQLALPAPETLFVLSGTEEDVDEDDRFEIYEVPDDSYLFLRSVRARVHRSRFGGSWYNSYAGVDLYRGSDFVRRTESPAYLYEPALATGLRFGPGDTVALEVFDGIDATGEFSDLVLSYHIVGEIVPDTGVKPTILVEQDVESMIQVEDGGGVLLDEAGDDIAIYEVPEGRRLIVTDLVTRVESVFAASSDINPYTVIHAHRVLEKDSSGEIVEVKSPSQLGGTTFGVPVWDTIASHKSQAYLTFGPGNSVVIEREVDGNPDPDGDDDDIVRYDVVYEMAGYLVDD